MNSSLIFDTKKIEYNVIYSKRKTLEISIKAPGIITVRAPIYMSEEQIEKNVRNKSKWIIEKLAILSKVDITPIKKEYVEGETFIYRGENYLLKVVIDEKLKKPEVKLYEDKLIITMPRQDEEAIKDAIWSWYKNEAKMTIADRVEHYSRYFNLKPNNIKIKAQKTRWGSCTYKNDLAFNYKLIMMPPQVLDYVVIHEMCHMEHKDHSKNFWSRVSSIMPDYKDKRKWLKEHGMKLCC